MKIRLACWISCAWLAVGCAEGAGADRPAPAGSGALVDAAGAPGWTPPKLESLADVDCSATPPAYEEVTALHTCTMCHAATKPAAERGGAPVSANFDTEAAAMSHASEAASLVMSGSMPPSSSGLSLTPAEKQQLYRWALCSMP